MKKLLIIAMLAICATTFAQQTPTNKTRSDNSFSQIDNYLIGLKRLGIPTSATDNLDASGLPQNTVKIIYNTTLKKLRIYDPTTETWKDASSADLSLFYKKTEVDSLLAFRVEKTTTVNGQPLSGNVTVTKSDIGLSDVDNTSDLGKPISISTQTALNGKQDALGYTPENIANKAINLTSPDNIKYLTTLAASNAFPRKDGTGATGFWNVTAANAGSATSAGNSTTTSAVSGTSGYMPKFTTSSNIGNGRIYDTGTQIGVGTSAPNAYFDVRGVGVFDSGVSASADLQSSPDTPIPLSKSINKILLSRSGGSNDNYGIGLSTSTGFDFFTGSSAGFGFYGNTSGVNGSSNTNLVTISPIGDVIAIKDLVAGGKLSWNSGSSNNSSIRNDSGMGTVITGEAGVNYDLTIRGRYVGSLAASIPAGTNNMTFWGGVYVQGKLTSDSAPSNPSDVVRLVDTQGGGTPPNITLGSSTVVGTGATISIAGNNVDGVITLTTGTGIAGAVGEIFVVTFGGSFSYPVSCTPVVMVSNIGTTSYKAPVLTSATNNSWGIKSAGTAPGAALADSTVYKYTYHVGGY